MLAALAVSLSAAGCSSLPPVDGHPYVPAAPCSTPAASVAFDFDGASQSRCIIEGEREFSIVISPERAPPINPSPWYAFRYQATPGPDVTVHLNYLYGAHRYAPKLASEGKVTTLDARVAEDGKTADIVLPPGTGTVSAQPLFGAARYNALFERLSRSYQVRRIQLGQSHDGYPIEALRMGRAHAPHLLILLGRAHPPEVSGAVAMEAFLEQLAALYDAATIDPNALQVLAVPLLNPDGVRRGHWRVNLGGRDLNRDWGVFSQPETSAVNAFLDRLPPATQPLAMIDFHSTRTNLFYVQGADETTPAEERFLADWLSARRGSMERYAFTIERRNANPGSGTSKNWFHARYGIPAYTYEVGDETDPGDTVAAARVLATGVIEALAQLRRDQAKDH